MTQYNSINIKLPNSQFDKLKSTARNAKGVTLRQSPNVIGMLMKLIFHINCY